MRIRTNLTDSQVKGVTETPEIQYEVRAEINGVYASRTHPWAFDVLLRGIHERMPDGKHRRRPNGAYGVYNGDRQNEWAATYDEWGWFLSALFDEDPTAIAGPYKGRDDFHQQTRDEYRRHWRHG